MIRCEPEDRLVSLVRDLYLFSHIQFDLTASSEHLLELGILQDLIIRYFLLLIPRKRIVSISGRADLLTDFLGDILRPVDFRQRIDQGDYAGNFFVQGGLVGIANFFQRLLCLNQALEIGHPCLLIFCQRIICLSGINDQALSILCVFFGNLTELDHIIDQCDDLVCSALILFSLRELCISLRRKLQFAGVVQIQCVGIVCIDHIAAFTGKRVLARILIAIRIAFQEQLIICSNRPFIAVCHIDKIIFTIIHRHDVPHMGASAGPSIHGSGNNAALHALIKITQIAKELICFCITLTNNVRIRIIIEHPDQLPWIAVRSVDRIICRLVVIRCQSADRTSVAVQLVQVTVAGIIVDNICRRISCCICSPSLADIDHRFLSICLIIRRYIECKFDCGIFVDKSHCRIILYVVHADIRRHPSIKIPFCFIKPVQIIRAIY